MHLSSTSQPPEPHPAWLGLIQVCSTLNAAIEAQLQSQWGLSHVEFEVLLRLDHSRRPLRVQDLSSRSLLSRSGTSRAVSRLALAGLVATEGVPEDGRGTAVALTNRGRALFAAVAPAHMALVDERFLSRFTAEELELLARFWKRVLTDQTVTGNLH